MKVAVIGGSRGVGRHCILQAIEQGISVTALARSPETLETIEASPLLSIIKGDALVQHDVDSVIRGSDAVIVSLGSGVGSPDITVCSRAMPLIINSMKTCNVKRLIVITSMGVGDSFNDISDRAKQFLKPYLDDKEIQERCVFENAGDIKWTIVRPSGLKDGERTGKYHFGKGIQSFPVQRADVADFTIKQLASEEWVGKTPSVCGLP